MLTAKYLASVKNLPAILGKVIAGTAPDKFTTEHLKGLGFTSSSDRAVIPLLKELGFLTADGIPTPRYHLYRDASKSKAVMADALREAYQDLFHLNAKINESDKGAIQGKFKSTHNISDRVAEMMTMTFFALLKLADLNYQTPSTASLRVAERPADYHADPERKDKVAVMPNSSSLNLRYTVEIHLPPTKDIEVYNAIFRSLKEN